MSLFRASRVLMAAAKPAAPKSAFVKNWLSDSATYPIMGIMASAIGLVIYQSQRILLNHPDVTFDKHDRASVVRDNDDDAEKHHAHFLRTASVGRQTSEIMPGLNALVVAGKVKN